MNTHSQGCFKYEMKEGSTVSAHSQRSISVILASFITMFAVTPRYYSASYLALASCGRSPTAKNIFYAWLPNLLVYLTSEFLPRSSSIIHNSITVF